MKTYEEIKTEIEKLVDQKASAEAFASYIRENIPEFPEDMQEDLFPLLFEYDLAQEVQTLEKITSALREKFPEFFKDYTEE